MKQLVEFPLDDGSTVVVEVDEPEPEGGLVRAARPGEIVARSQQTFEGAVDKVRPAVEVVTNSVITKMRELRHPPDEITVTFGLKMNTAAGAFFASVGTEATFEITLVWRHVPEVIVKPNPDGLIPGDV